MPYGQLRAAIRLNLSVRRHRNCQTTQDGETIVQPTPFGGELYRDDRMFVLHISKCTVAAVDSTTLETTIYHEGAPPSHKWCVVTYRNTATYPSVRVDHFLSLSEAREYVEKVEPMVPLVSLDGRPPKIPLAYSSLPAWKARNNFKDYDYKAMYAGGGSSPKELILSRRS